MSTAAHQLIHSSASNDWLTPSWVLDIARKVMGGIDLDPASSVAANARVQAARFIAPPANGLIEPWGGRVWLNPPYGKVAGKSGAGAWLTRMGEAYRESEIDQGMLLINASIGDAWFNAVWGKPMCLFHRRIRYDRPDGTPGDSPTKGNALVYFGNRHKMFARYAGKHGEVILPT